MNYTTDNKINGKHIVNEYDWNHDNLQRIGIK